MLKVMEDREVWRFNLKLLPPKPSRKSEQWRKKKNDVTHLAELQYKNNLLPLASVSVRSASLKILVVNASVEISVMLALIFKN